MSHFGMSFDQVLKELPYRDLVFLSSSVPKYKTKEEKEESKGDLASMLNSQIKNQ